MGKLVMILAVLGVAYWYWSGPYKESAANSGSDELRENAAIMQRCIKQEERMQAAGGLAGVADVGSGGQDAQTLCAEKNNLVLQDGKWHRRGN
jgi:hypothetical protein